MIEAEDGSLCFLYNLLTCHVIDRFLSRELSTELSSSLQILTDLETVALKMQVDGKVLIAEMAVRLLARRHPRKLASTGLLQLDGCWCRFPHLTFQEFFAGRALAS